MTDAAQPITTEQLARLYAARNQANSELSAAHCAKPRDRDAIERLRQRASALNGAYEAGRKQYKRQQKAATRAQWRTTMIQFYIDHQEAADASR